MALENERRIPLSRERVLRAAVEMADDGGIESLSMRKLGQVLGVEAMSLYNHVANKSDLLNGIVELVLDEFELPSPDEGWETAIRKCAISAHDTLVQHPWACNLMMSSRGVSEGRLRYMEAVMRCFREAGFDPGETYHAYHAIDSHILGFTLWQLGHAMPAGETGDVPRIQTKEELTAFIARFLPTFSQETYPYLTEHGVQHISAGSHKDVPEYEFVLDMILDGLRRMRASPD